MPGAVPVEVLGSPLRGSSGSEVGAVTAEDLDPLSAGVVDRAGNQVGDVPVLAARHPDVCGHRARMDSDRNLGDRHGVSLDAIGRGRVRQFHMSRR